MTDLFAFDVNDGLASGRCPLCHAAQADFERWIDSFWREGRKDPAARRRFYDGGGFCARHAWLLHDRIADHGKSGAPIADLYGALADRDLAELERGVPQRHGPCSACVAESEALERKTHFLLELLSSPTGRERYERSQGLCFRHLASAVERCEKDRRMRGYLIAEWRNRLSDVRARLEEFDRKRDHRFAAEMGEDDRQAWSDVIRRYAGERELPRQP